jgi:CheY-like chemotaxis protein
MHQHGFVFVTAGYVWIFASRKKYYTMMIETAIKKKVLIVDDDEFSVFLCETLLQEHFELHSVSNGYDALKIVEEQEFDAILMDINLGDSNMDGIRTMRIIKHNRRHRNKVIFAITAYSNDRHLYINHGFDDMFVKPLIGENIIDKLQAKINKKSLVF